MIKMDKGDILISVVIPTFNSERTLKACLESIKRQSEKNIEIIVVDGFSSDNTLKIARYFRCKVIQTKWRVLGARYIGAKNSNGKYILMVDSDQILKDNKIIEKSMKLMRKYDMLVLEEDSINKSTFLEKAASADRKLVHKLYEAQIDPLNGVLVPRFFDRKIILKAFKNINIGKLHDIMIFEDAIVYYEAYKISKKIGILSNAILHNEPKNFREFFKHNYRYGVAARELKNTEYKELIKTKTRFRKDSLKSNSLSLIIYSFILVLLKGIAYELGYIFGR